MIGFPPLLRNCLGILSDLWGDETWFLFSFERLFMLREGGSVLVLTVFLWCSGPWEQCHPLPERWHLEWLLPRLPGDERRVLSPGPAQQQPQTPVPRRLCHRYDVGTAVSRGRGKTFWKLSLVLRWVVGYLSRVRPLGNGNG